MEDIDCLLGDYSVGWGRWLDFEYVSYHCVLLYLSLLCLRDFWVCPINTGFNRRGWTDFVMVSRRGISDGQDERPLSYVVVPRFVRLNDVRIYPKEA